jgi:hypothetical protein
MFIIRNNLLYVQFYMVCLDMYLFKQSSRLDGVLHIVPSTHCTKRIENQKGAQQTELST